ncbi:MAG: hypothetical protein KDB02_09145 [Acidimicrobiales bacterium]|nr:hypothetical protein [Acidimicrobiales bacterium]
MPEEVESRTTGVTPGYFFVHLQKTAGTALFRRLRHHFGVDSVYPRPDEQGTPEVVLGVDRLVRRLKDEPGGYQVITGHFPFAVVDLLPTGCRTFTLLRDPVERTLSWLRHQREVEPRFEGWELAAIYEDPVASTGLLQNHQVKMLSMTIDEMTDGALSPIVVDDRRVAAAIEVLEHRIDVMGVQEDFEGFCDALEARFGWDLGDPVFMNRTRPAPDSQALRRRITADNQADIALYAAARDIWAQRRPA